MGKTLTLDGIERIVYSERFDKTYYDTFDKRTFLINKETNISEMVLKIFNGVFDMKLKETDLTIMNDKAIFKTNEKYDFKKYKSNYNYEFYFNLFIDNVRLYKKDFKDIFPEAIIEWRELSRHS